MIARERLGKYVYVLYWAVLLILCAIFFGTGIVELMSPEHVGREEEKYGRRDGRRTLRREKVKD